MWHPFDDLGVPLNISGPSTITINATRVAPIICYEQLLAFPVLDAMRSHPALILGVANDYWARDTTIPQLQSSSLIAWSRLFWIPVVTAVNQ
jgi:apolipoprotein N-acyltransferase